MGPEESKNWTRGPREELPDVNPRANGGVDRVADLGGTCRRFIAENKLLLAALAAVTLSAYGFELFNMNLTIDEEVFVFSSTPPVWFIQGRWGMYLLNRFLLPYPVIPFVPLAVALVFHLAAVLLLLRTWGVRRTWPQVLVGGVALAYPGLTYQYSMAILNYGLGIGFFCAALSVFMLARASGWRRLLAAIPASFALAIYQGFVPVLAAVYLVHFIAATLEEDHRKIDLGRGLWLAGTLVLAGGLYLLVQRLFQLAGAPASSYINRFFDLPFLRENAPLVLSRTWQFLLRVYLGDASIYGRTVAALGITLGLGLVGLAIGILRSNLLPLHKALVTLLGVGLVILPFVPGLLTRGELEMRFLICLAVVIMGWLTLGLMKAPRVVQSLLGIVGGVCLFQFIVSTNTLYYASHLASEADRLLASRLIAAIDDARASAGVSHVRYLEVVGYPEWPEADRIAKEDTIGASFFEWDQGNVYRVQLFLRDIGYSDLEPLPPPARGQLIPVASAMPVWPDLGSVGIEGETVIVKFGPYSLIQRQVICQATWIDGFCP